MFSRRLVYTLIGNTLLTIKCNNDTQNDVKIDTNIEESVITKGALESARNGPISRSGVMRHFVHILHYVESVPLSLHI